MTHPDLRAARANRVFRTDSLFIRAQSTIRADGTPSAQYRAYTVGSMQPVLLRAARANRVFRTDERHPYGKCGFG
jgi:hypothetical protein